MEKGEVKIKVITFLGDGRVEVQYIKEMGGNSHGKFRVDIPEVDYFKLTRSNRLEQYFTDL